MNETFFPALTLPTELVQDLLRQNPWWQGQALPVIPPYRRWPFAKLLARLNQPLASILVIRGPRQIGKTTLQLQLVQALMAQGVEPRRILRAQFDDLPSLRAMKSEEPILRIVEWPSNSTAPRSWACSASRTGPPCKGRSRPRSWR